MRISISNYNDGQVVGYNLVLLKGSIDTADHSDGEPATLGRSLSTESCSSTSSSDSSRWNVPTHFDCGSIKTFLKNFDRHEKYELSLKIVRNRFILLIELSEGINCVFFQDETGKVIKEFRIKFLPSSNDCYVKPLYIVCSDSYPEGGNDDENFRLNQRKIHLGLKIIQALYAEKLFEWGLSRRTFTLVNDSSSCEVIQIPRTTQEVRELETKHLWDLLAREIRANSRIWDTRCKYVAFMADPWKPQRAEKLENSPALAGGGLALIGSDFLQVWSDQFQNVLKQLGDESPIDVQNFTFGSFSRNVGSLFSASLGGLAHEIGHIFDLGHTEGGLMGNQYHRIDLCLSPLVSYPKSVVHVYSADDERQIRPKVCLPNGHIAEDCVSLSFSCATLLFFHRWFRSTPGRSLPETGPVLTKNTISSNVGLTVIEIRDLDNGTILKSWTFDRVKVRYEFHMGKSTIPSDQSVVDVIAQDFHGNILKCLA
ncbi:unnamed protein product [Allacma fusca]|uniref:Zinc metalloproteinase n=1 Tax=Allacma fusca TaxID=39272 RepID=A0A8J2JRY9_9HEXA|nr:unnamed protein product [Allacma fusca]